MTEFADHLASCLLKETIKESGESGAGGEGDWSIPCSSECHQHISQDTDHSSRPVTITKRRSGSGQLCWTPESGASMETSAVTSDHCHEGASGQCSESPDTSTKSPVRRGVSVPNVNIVSERLELETSSEHSSDHHDRVSCSSENLKSHKKGFLSSFGLRHRVKHNNGGPKMKNFKKTISSLFSQKHSRTEHNSSTQSSSSSSSGAKKNIFKLPSTVRQKLKPTDPCHRALPPVPPPRDDVEEDDDDDDSLTPHHSPSLPVSDNPESEALDFTARYVSI